MKEKLYVIKIGGAVLESADMRTQFLQGFSALQAHKILVHGGGRLATDIGLKMGLHSQMVDGRRITDDEFIGVVTMVYGGLVNKQLVSSLQALGCNAIGMTGADGDLIHSKKRPIKNGVDYGWVGDPEKVNLAFLSALLQQKITPVLAPLTHDGAGHMLNTNADTIASEIAQAASSQFDVQLVFGFELEGVLQDFEDKASVIKHINPEKYALLKENKIVSEGMLPKLDNAVKAIASGVSSVKIMRFDKLDMLNDESFDRYTNITA